MHGEARYSADTVVNTDDEGNVTIETPAPAASSGREPLSEDEAMKQARIFMDMRETLQAMAIAGFADGSLDGYTQYYYQAFEKNLLVEAYAPFIQKAGLRMNPYVRILYAEAVTGGPKIALMLNNRKYRLEAEKWKEKYHKEAQKNGASSTNTKVLRQDTQRRWKIDTKGYFEGTETGVFIPKPDRRIKPDLTIPGTYELLVKHNGEDFVKRALGI